MTINSRKINLTIIIIGYWAGIGTVMMCGSISGIGELASFEEDNRVNDTNYLDMPTEENGENEVRSNGLFYVIMLILVGVSAFILLKFGLNLKKMRKFLKSKYF